MLEYTNAKLLDGWILKEKILRNLHSLFTKLSLKTALTFNTILSVLYFLTSKRSEKVVVTKHTPWCHFFLLKRMP